MVFAIGSMAFVTVYTLAVFVVFVIADKFDARRHRNAKVTQ